MILMHPTLVRLEVRGPLAAILLAVFILSGTRVVHGSVTTVGAVSPVPPAAGGAVGAGFVIGDAAFGSVTVTAGTAINSTGGAIVGNGVGGIGSVSLSGFGSNWTILTATSDLTIGDEGVGSLSVATQAVVNVPDDTLLGAQTTGSGRLTVTGLGSIYDSVDDFTVGVNGAGLVEILSGGAFDSNRVTIGDNVASHGTVTVSGDLSRWTASGSIVVGDAGTGRLEIFSGGRVTNTIASGMVVGNIVGSVGSVEVAGVGSVLQLANGLNLGSFGSATMLIRDGGRVTTGISATIGSSADGFGELTIDGAGSRLGITGALLASAGNSQVALSNGGTLSTTAVSTITTTSRVTLAGGRWTSTAASNSAITVGGGLLQGSGTLDVQGVAIDGSPLGRLQTSAGDHLLVTGLVANNGLVDLNGGELEVRGVLTNSGDVDARNGATLRVGGTGFDNNSGSQLAISGGTVDVFGTVDNNTGAEIAVVGGATGVFHDAVTNNGTIFVSASSEIVLLENLGFSPSSALSVGLASIDPTDAPTDAFGLLNIGGASTLGGEIVVELAAGFAPALGETFEVLRTSSGISGTFATETLPTLGGGLALDVQYTPTSVLLAVVNFGVPGDYNANGTVDAADYTVWRNNLGRSTALPNDDTAGVAADDYNRWKTHFGESNGSGSGVSVVPETTSFTIVVTSLLGISLFGRTRSAAPT